MYWFGLIILSSAVGHRWERVDGWLTLGAGIIAFVLLRALFRRIPVRK
jgi:hypothetical protein